MASECLLVLFSVLHFLILLSAADEVENCPKFSCGKLGPLQFPFTNTTKPECGLRIRGCDPGSDRHPEVLMGNGEWYEVTSTYGPREKEISFSVIDHHLVQVFQQDSCTALDNYNNLLPPLPLPVFSPMMSARTPMMSFLMENTETVFRCNVSVSREIEHTPYAFEDSLSIKCDDSHFYRRVPPNMEDQFNSCSRVQLPLLKDPKPYETPDDILSFLIDEINTTVILFPDCNECYYERGGQCQFTGENLYFKCAGGKSGRSIAMIIGLAIGCPAALGLLILLLCKRKYITSKFQYKSRNMYAHPTSISDQECSTVFFGIPVFSYQELKEATNNFDSARELGDGGFGTVYYGKLRDGREVAVKRLYEHNYRRVEQFMNEIAILPCLRHNNLVSFYGCTSRHSRELLLVYEYIPNGTLAFHLHGDLAKPGKMKWPLRMKIAIEMASALAYLHASNIIHRDVKTNNILLDNSFCVKVADFGLSRLFPQNVTHISTTPQGTPGYVDPEYRQCYQLTNKSDVYSFGVVLIELISALPAVDTDRQRGEINLANLAIKRIENCEVGELVDPSLGFETDKKVKRMIESVAQLALRCLQLAKEYRPSMDEVLEELKRIESGNEKGVTISLGESDVHVDGISIHIDGISNRYVHPPKPRIIRTN